MAPLPPGVAGGIARARHAWRYDDGTFMSYDNEEQIRLEQRERMARGGLNMRLTKHFFQLTLQNCEVHFSNYQPHRLNSRCHHSQPRCPPRPRHVVDPDTSCLMVERGHRRIRHFYPRSHPVVGAEGTGLLTVGQRRQCQRRFQGRK